MAHSSSRREAPSSVFRLARRSTVDLIASELRAAIYSGALPIGSALREVEISAQLGVSRSPFREGAQRLVQEGLLTAVPGRGLRVSSIEPGDVADLYAARIAVESQAIRAVVRTESAGTIAMIEHALEELVRASAGDDAWEIGDADLLFHQTLVDAAGSPRLSRMMSTLAIETRIASLSHPDGYAVRRSVSPTYRALLDALVAGDAAAAILELERQFDDAVARLNGRGDTVDTVETDTEEQPLEFTPLEALPLDPA